MNDKPAKIERAVRWLRRGRPLDV